MTDRQPRRRRRGKGSKSQEPDLLAVLLHRRRRQLGLTQGEAAEVVGVSRAAYDAWEATTSSPKPKHIPRLAAFLEMDHDGVGVAQARLTSRGSDAGRMQPVSPLGAITDDSVAMLQLTGLATLEQAIRSLEGAVRTLTAAVNEKADWRDGAGEPASQLGPLMTLAEDSALLGIHRRTAYKLIQEGKFPVRVVRIAGRLKVNREHIDTFLSSGAQLPEEHSFD